MYNQWVDTKSTSFKEKNFAKHKFKNKVYKMEFIFMKILLRECLRHSINPETNFVWILFFVTHAFMMRTWSYIRYNPTQSYNEFKSLTKCGFFHKIGFKFSLRRGECVIYDGDPAMLIYVCISISVSPQIIFVATTMWRL